MKTTFYIIILVAIFFSAITVSVTSCNTSKHASTINDSTDGNPPKKTKSMQLINKTNHSDSTDGNPPKQN